MVSLKDVFEYLKALLMGFHSKNRHQSVCWADRLSFFFFFFLHLCNVVEENIHDGKILSGVSRVASSLLPGEIRKHITVMPILEINGHCSLRKSISCEVLGYLACCVCLCIHGLCGLPACVWMCSLLTTRDQKNLNLSTNCFTYLMFSHVSSP